MSNDILAENDPPVGLSRCALCHGHKVLVQSHIIPKFAVNWLKKTGSGFFRTAVNPNIKYQDLSTQKLLCGSCEQLFCQRESIFFNSIFEPYLEAHQTEFTYDKNLYYFLLSVLWRVLVSRLPEYTKACPKFAQNLCETEDSWRKYLLSQKGEIKSDVHLFVTDISQDYVVPVKRFNLYMARGMDATVAAGKNSCLVYAKFVRFCIFAFLTDYDPGLWVNTRIVNGDGVLITPQEIRDGRIGGFLVTRVREAMTQYHQKLSTRQRDRISAHQKKILSTLANSDMGEALLMDSLSSVDTSFFPRHQIHRNEPCPCGSGLKFKNCCGGPRSMPALP